ncbi:MFS transporter [Gleimia sp. 6138-11-ORH1]|uniref:MFS transporter n=1 Tax=Gleimia sp. 6138-11-ORH1 TaxID=2973937 RepID=UPI002168B5CB|nr:MFS transporter [Gleimia sp. 6138-11-ORH1]MCS4484116.1 MFS transporter [Gleimia sp. 6138-11-ORH1]
MEKKYPNDTSQQTGGEHWKRNISLFLSGQSISMFGSMLVQFALMWYLTLETKSATIVALYAIFAFGPQGLITLFGGTLADRLNRKLLIVIPDAVIAIATLILAMLIANGYTDLWIIFTVVTIRSIAAGIQQPAVTSLIPALVPPGQLLRINGIHTSLQSLIGVVAPAAGGVIYGLGGVEKMLYVDVITAIIGIGMLFFVSIPKHIKRRNQADFYTELIGGIRYTATHRFGRWLLTVYSVMFILAVSPSFLVPLFIAQKFDAGVWELTIIETLLHVGIIVGGLAVATVLARRSRIKLLLLGATAVSILTMVMSFSPHVWFSFTVMFLVGCFVPLFAGPSITELQERIDPIYMGRVMSQVSIVFILSMPLGMVVFGPLSEYFGVGNIILAAGVASFSFIVYAFGFSATGKASLRGEHRTWHKVATKPVEE